MAWYYGVYSCNHEGKVNIIGPGQTREWKKERIFSGLCPECYKKKLEEDRMKANIEAAEKSAEMELPELTGSEKQVAWANTLRLNFIEKVEKEIERINKQIEKENTRIKELEKAGNPVRRKIEDVKFYARDEYMNPFQTTREELDDMLMYAIKKHNDARFWIDSRDSGRICKLILEYKEYEKENDIPEDVKQEEAESKKNLTVIPETENLKSGVVEIEYKDKILYARYIKNDDFIKVVKKLGYKWKGVWCKKITEYTGTVEDRAAELGNVLLLNGFTVLFPNTESKDRAVSADFEPENDRWIKYIKELEKFVIVWEAQNDILYKNAKKLPGAKWSNGGMQVDIEFYKEVEDFAKTMGFSISKKAREEIGEYRKKESRFETINVSVKIKENISDEERLEKSLKYDGTIIGDLIDD